MIAIFCLAKGGLRQHQNYCSEQAMVAVDMGGMEEVLIMSYNQIQIDSLRLVPAVNQIKSTNHTKN